MKKALNGFTIIELLVVVAIIGVLAAVGFVSYSSIKADVRDSSRSVNITLIAQALEKYYNKNGEYPSCAAMQAQPANVVTTNTLLGMDPSALTAPTASNGTNSITECSGSPSNDVYYYVGGGSQYILKYVQESNNTVALVYSKHKSPTTPITAIAAITGTTEVGSVLTAGALTPSGATATYQWTSSATSGGTYTNISGATVPLPI